jgi:hypothetical protein
MWTNHQERQGPTWTVLCACGWTTTASNRHRARLAYREHLATTPWCCPKCYESDPERRAGSPDTALCKSCLTQRVRHWAARNKARWEEGRRASHLRKSFGLSVEDYDALLASQGGVCAICGKHPNDAPKRFHVDHDHATGAVRGILCHTCNQGLGQFKDDVARMRAAVAYLERFGAE